MKPTPYLLAGLLALSVFAASGCAQRSNVPPPLRKPVACMMGVLKATPGVTKPKVHVVTEHGSKYVLVEFRADQRASWTTSTTFTVSQDSDGRIWASTTLPGIFTPGTTLDTHVTDAVTQAWHSQCKVTAMVMTV